MEGENEELCFRQTADSCLSQYFLEYEQVQLEDGTFAIIESSILKSFMDQQKLQTKKSQPPKEVTKAYDCPHENCNKAYTTMHHLRVTICNFSYNIFKLIKFC